jgi:hypothetical protein
LTDSNAIIETFNYLARAAESISEGLVFTFSPVTIAAVKEDLDKQSIEYDPYIGDNEIRIEPRCYAGFSVYNNQDSFLRHISLGMLETGSVLILSDALNETVFVSKVDGHLTAKNYVSQTDNESIVNAFYVLKIQDELLKVTDYYDSAHKNYFFLSPECGKLELHGPDLTSLDLAGFSLESSLRSLEVLTTFASGYECIFKNKLIRCLELVREEDRFIALLKQLEVFVDATKKDFEIFITRQSYEGISAQFENEKQSFIDQLRSLLERISSAVLSIPVSFAAALFAVKDVSEGWMLSTLKFAFFLFVLFSCVTNGMFIVELQCIKNTIEDKVNSFSRSIPFLHTEFKKNTKPLRRRVVFLQAISVFVILLFAFFTFIFLKTDFKK